MQRDKNKNTHHSKQERFIVKDRPLSVNEVREGEAHFNYVRGKGLFLVTKFRGQIYTTQMDEGYPA